MASGRRVFGEDGVAEVVLDRRVGLDVAEQGVASGAIAGLFQELAGPSRHRIFARVDHAAGNFERDLGRAEAELLDQDHFVVGVMATTFTQLGTSRTKKSCSPPVRGETKRWLCRRKM